MNVSKTTYLSEFIEKVHGELQFYVQNNNNACAKRSICLTGGRAAKALYEHKEVQSLLRNNFTDFYFGDERCVGPRHPESNYHLVMRSLFSNDGQATRRLHRMYGDSSKLEEEADRYATLLPENIDVLLLSVGEDGHIASLFPNSTAVNEEIRKVVPIFNAPKPPAVRLSITQSVVRSAKKVIVMAAGAEKGVILSKALASPFNITELPDRLTIGSVWVLDRTANDSFKKNLPVNHHKTRIIYA